MPGNFLTVVRDGLASMVSGLGTERDKAATVYYTEPQLDQQQLVNAYRGSWMARKIVDIPALDSCRNWRAWQAKADQIAAIEAEEKRLNVKGKTLEARKKSRLFGGAAIYMDFGDDASQPLDLERVEKGALRFLTVFTPRQLIPGEIETDPMSEFYGRPKSYSMVSGSAGQVTIHPSRLTIFYGNELPENDVVTSAASAWGDSVLTSCMDAVKQAESTSANVASLVFEANVDVIAMDGLMDLVGKPDGERKITERYRIAMQGKGNIKTLILDGKEKYDRKSITFGSLPDLIDRFNQNSAGAADIPMTRFFGMSPGGLNASGDSDLRNYYDRVRAGQELEMQPAMYRQDEALIRSATGQRDPAIYYEWNPLWQMSEKEKADVFKTKADAARTIVGAGGKALSIIPINAVSDALVNELVEDGTLAGLEAAIAQHGKLSEQKPAKTDPGAVGSEAPAKPVTDAAPRTLYVSRKLLNADEFIEWAKGQGFKTTTPADDLHVTITFSRAPVDWLKMGENWSGDRNGNVTVQPGGARIVEALGDKGAVVLLFNSATLSYRHESMMQAGASWDFPEYQPHVTITYQGQGVDLSKVEPYRGKLVFGPEIFAELNDDWSSKLREAAFRRSHHANH